jgi:protein-S-isoprenylcysteine O-methyltransferase Ste14
MESPSLSSCLRPPRIAMGLLAAAVAAHAAIGSREGWRLFAAPAAGGFLAATGALLMLWAWGVFRRRGIPVRPAERSGALAVRGPFRVSRNPMYLGMAAMLGGAALWMGTLPFYAAALVFVGVIDRVFIPFEEARLEKEFGAAYSRYRSRVRRWL